MPVHMLHRPMDDTARGDAIFAGDLLVFTDVEGLDAFCARVDDLVRAGFGVDDPELAQYELPRERYLDAVRTTQASVRADEQARRLLLDVLHGTGMDPDQTYWDWVHLRILPSGAEFAGNGTGWHRDTWASSLDAQTNWWTPIYPVTADRTITFAPTYWSTAVANTSAAWSPGSAEVIPRPVEPLDPPQERIVIEPGDLLCFSGAQMHGSVPNHTGRARFSVEVRTLSSEDLRHGRGVSPIDGEAPRRQYGWFRHVVDGSRLADPAA